jgi:hypothetical protein
MLWDIAFGLDSLSRRMTGAFNFCRHALADSYIRQKVLVDRVAWRLHPSRTRTVLILASQTNGLEQPKRKLNAKMGAFPRSSVDDILEGPS